MRLRNASLSALLAGALLSSSTVAGAAPVEGTRTGSEVTGEQLSGGLGPAWLVAAILVAALGIVVFANDDDDAPVSP